MLGAVAVVDVEVEDQDLVHAVGALEVARRDRHVVEQAEPQRHTVLGVVTGRAAQREAVPDVARYDAVGQREGAPRREAGHVATLPRDPDVGHVEEGCAGSARLLGTGDVARVVHCFDPRRVRFRRLDTHEVLKPAALLQPSHRRDEALAPFRMAAARVVIEEAGVVEESCCHR